LKKAHSSTSPRRQTELDKAVSLIGRDVAAVRGDVSNLADLDRLYTKIASEKGKIDILFAGAGIVDPQPLAETTEESFDKLFAINTRALAFTVKKALPLLNDGGAIIVITSIADNKGIPGFTAYGASKAAVRSFVRTWTAEVKDRRIRVNAISPGPIDTPIFEQQAPTKEGSRPSPRPVRRGRPVRSARPPGRDRVGRLVPRFRRSKLHRGRGSPSRRRHVRDLKLSARRLRRHPRRGWPPLSDAVVRQASLSPPGPTLSSFMDEGSTADIHHTVWVSCEWRQGNRCPRSEVPLLATFRTSPLSRMSASRQHRSYATFRINLLSPKMGQRHGRIFQKVPRQDPVTIENHFGLEPGPSERAFPSVAFR
jgi:NAD(P)-dependent dehydrogenase (short-subunit alcohol dehydrogenase family)